MRQGGAEGSRSLAAPGRVGTPEGIARACLYLSHPDNTFVTGAHLVIDGGMTRTMIYEE
ncbi:SDR family oxidoreductase [Fontibacillus phaseoli]|uniref:SDR family oxidoreductase n=1 Tax=Fontibacillus phaseoli TaxID=1416533 RepID=UPI000DF19AA9|nr:SDR family oxidoreductase [Fontibacillus phaseoli]